MTSSGLEPWSIMAHVVSAAHIPDKAAGALYALDGIAQELFDATCVGVSALGKVIPRIFFMDDLLLLYILKMRDSQTMTVAYTIWWSTICKHQ
jgi:hypothetical protein